MSAGQSGAGVVPDRKQRGLTGLIKLARDGSLSLIGRLLRDTGREYARRYGLVLLLGLVTAGTAALNAWILKDIINNVFLDRRADLLYLLTAVVIATGFVRAGSIYGAAMVLGRIGNSIVARLQRRMYDHLLTLGSDFYAATPASDLVTRMSYNAQSAQRVLDTLFTHVGRDLMTLIALIGVMVAQSPVMSLVVLGIGPIAVFTLNKLSVRIKRVARAQFDSLGEIVSAMQQTATANRIIKAFNLEDAARQRMGESIERVRRNADKIVSIRARTTPFAEIMAGIAVGSIVFWAGYRSIAFGEQPGALMSFIAALLFSFDPAKRLANVQIPLAADLVGVRLMFDLLDTKPTMNVNPDGPDLAVTKGEIVFDQVDFSYPGGAEVVRGLNLVAPGGKTTALVGPSGGGKSTLITLVERFFDIARGRITIDGLDISKVRIASLREQLALVTQETVLFNGTIRQNIRFGRPGASDGEVEAAARAALAHDFIMATPNGYDTAIGEGAAGLSGGQRQRLAIARAMLRNAPILLLDEATSALDAESEKQVQVALDRLRQGRTTIVIAHRLSTVLGADKIAVLVAGRIVEEGRHADLLQSNANYARLYHLQFEQHAKGTAEAAE